MVDMDTSSPTITATTAMATSAMAIASTSASPSRNGYDEDILRAALALPVEARREIAQALIWSLPRDEVLVLNSRLSTMLQKDIVGLLPPELAFLILSKLDLEDLLRCSLVSTSWAKLCNEQALWALLCASHQPPIRPAETTWADITRHRQLMQAVSPTRNQQACNEDSSYEADDDDDRDRDRDRFGTYSGHSGGMGDTDVLLSQGGLGGGGGLDPLGMTGGLRRTVWERGGAGSGTGLPTHLHLPRPTPTSASAVQYPEAIIPSYLAIPSAKPQPNYKHLFIAHHILSKRMTTPRPPDTATAGYGSTSKPYIPDNRNTRPIPIPIPRTIDAISSVKAGGLPGHTEAVYSLSLINHSMRIDMLQACPDCHVQQSTTSASTSATATTSAPSEDDQSVFNPFATLTAITPSHPSHPARRFGRSPPITDHHTRSSATIHGREWLLSGSRDKTLRLWHIGSPEPRVVKIYNGGHTGSVLTHCVVQVPLKPSSESSAQPLKPGRSLYTPPMKSDDDRARTRTKVLAVSGGSDGKLCLWDVEGDGNPLKVVQAHSDSVLCVRADEEHVVTCSKDKTIKLFDIRSLDELLVIGGGADEATNHRGAVNAVGLSKDFIVSASGDKTIRLWSIHDGSLLTCVEAHHRGIASIDLSLRPQLQLDAQRPGQVYRGTIVTGSSDASMKMFDILQVPSESVRAHISSSHSSRRDSAQTRMLSEGEREGEGGEEGEGSEGEMDTSTATATDLSFREMLDMDTHDILDLDLNANANANADANANDIDIGDSTNTRNRRNTRLILRQTAKNWASCVCPPGLTKPDGLKCGRCHNRGHTDLVRSVYLSHEIVVSGSYDSSVKIWDRTTGKLVADLTSSQQRGRGRIFSVVADRTRVISSGLDCRINIWDFAYGLDTSFVEP